jgi:hypothetical protein
MADMLHYELQIYAQVHLRCPELKEFKQQFLKGKEGRVPKECIPCAKKSSGQNDETKFNDVSKTYRLEATNETPLLVIFQQVKTM